MKVQPTGGLCPDPNPANAVNFYPDLSKDGIGNTVEGGEKDNHNTNDTQRLKPN